MVLKVGVKKKKKKYLVPDDLLDDFYLDVKPFRDLYAHDQSEGSLVDT